MDHGAQFLTIRNPQFEALVAPLLKSGEMFVWSNGFSVWHDGSISPRPPGHPRYAFRSGMSTLPKALAQSLELSLGDAATKVACDPLGNWSVTLASGVSHRAKALLVNAPPAQLVSLIGAFLDDETRLKISQIEMAPTWAVFDYVDRDPELRGVALELERHPVLSWVARDHTRRAPGQPPALVVHCNENWSRENLEARPEFVAETVASALRQLFGIRFIKTPEVHRWKYATPLKDLGELCFWSERLRLGACGDWCSGGRVEGAVLSGLALSQRASLTP
jgi:predicted NAD/FAD-dependent oxidoreductase